MQRCQKTRWRFHRPMDVPRRNGTEYVTVFMKWSTEDKDVTKVTKVRTSRRSHLVGPAARNQGAGAVQGLERAGVGPPAAKDLVRHRARCDVAVVDVGDLELAAAEGFRSRT